MCAGERDITELDRLLQGIEQFVALGGGDGSPYELGERLIRLQHGIDLLELRFARDAAAFAATDEAIAQGSTSPIDWVRHQCAMSGNAAARSITTGEEAARLPASVAALEHSVGRFAFDCTHARHAADAAAVLAEHVTAVECRRLELTKCEDGRVVIRGLLDPAGVSARPGS